MRRGKHLIIGVLLVASAILASCRPSQQTRRGTAANSRNANAAQASTKQMDSVLMLQDKLLNIIDTMTNVVAQDRARIHALEIEIAKLKSLLEQQQSMNSPVTPPPAYAPQQNYTAPPPPPAPQNTYSPPSKPASIEQPQQTSYPPNDKYNTALRYFNDGKYLDALTSFDELARTDGSSQYAPNYLYWKGESLYALSQYDEAIRTFHDVLTKYPSASKADDAEFKIGAAYEKLGDKTNAKAAYQRLIYSFPESEYRTRAESRLNKLK
jgi:tol-pal system protein YbgF